MGEIIVSPDGYFCSPGHNSDWKHAAVSRLIPQRGRSHKKNCTIPLGGRAALVCDIPCRVNSVQNDYVINHTQIAHICVIDTHSATRFNPGLDDFAQLVHNVTRSVENITARIVRVILANDERFGGLLIGNRALLNRRRDDRSRYRYWFCGGLCTFRTWLCKCQQRNQRAGNSNNCFLHHNASYV